MFHRCWTGVGYALLQPGLLSDFVGVLNHGRAETGTVERLRRAVKRLAAEGIIETTLLGRARRQLGDDRLVRLVAGIKAAAPNRTLQQIAIQRETMQERTPRGGTPRHPSSVKHLPGRAEHIGLVGTAAARIGSDLWR